MLSPPNHWTKFNQIWYVSYSHEWGSHRQFFFAPPPRTLGRGQKVKYHLISFKYFYTKLCVCTHKWKIQNISDGIFILSPGSCPKGGTWGVLRSQIKFHPAVCPSCYLLLNHWPKFNQIWCVSCSHKWDVQRQFFLPAPWGPWEESKGQISFNFYYKVNFKDFYTKLCVCTHNWKTRNISEGIFILSPGTLRRWGCPGGQKFIFFKHSHVAYQINEDD